MTRVVSNSGKCLIEVNADGIKMLPQGWGARRLKEVASVRNSNVDKKSKDGECAVYLCNYVDVYKNDFIDGSIEFMPATATSSEIKAFELKKHDILITKDSETNDDIAIPALVSENIPGTLCGYHLAQIRTKRKVLHPPYLHRLFQSHAFLFRFNTHAKGITRVGLGQSALLDATVPLPPLPEQQAIAEYLDRKTGAIDQKLELLKKKAQLYRDLKKSLINETVTRGLDKSASLRNSGVEWIGKIPQHWAVKRAKDFYIEVKSVSSTGREQLLSVSEYTGVSEKDNDPETGENSSRATSLVGYRKCRCGDLVINTMLAWKCGLGIAPVDGIVSPAYAVYRSNRTTTPGYMHYLMRNAKTVAEFKRNSTGIMESRLRLYPDNFLALQFPFPPTDEQNAIASYLAKKSEKLDRIVETIEAQIAKLKELRKSLINDIVTGKTRVTPTNTPEAV